jgi:hypothetical protein
MSPKFRHKGRNTGPWIATYPVTAYKSPVLGFLFDQSEHGLAVSVGVLRRGVVVGWQFKNPREIDTHMFELALAGDRIET